MRVQKIFKKSTGESLIKLSDKDIKQVNPIKYYGDFYIVRQMIFSGVPDDELHLKKEPSEESKKIFREAIESWKEKLAEIKNVNIPENLIKLLSSKKKSEQEKLLRDVSLTPNMLYALIFKAYEDYSYLFSQYNKAEKPQKGIDLSKMPHAYELKDDGDVNIFGNTELTKGQLKQAIKHRKVVISNFLEKEDDWHCFFANYRSLNGEEVWLGKNQPHYHYISSAFGLSKEKVLKELKSGDYKLKSIHVKLEEYGKQSE